MRSVAKTEVMVAVSCSRRLILCLALFFTLIGSMPLYAQSNLNTAQLTARTYKHLERFITTGQHRDSLIYSLDQLDTQAKKSENDSLLGRAQYLRAKYLSHLDSQAQSTQLLDRAAQIFRRQGDSLYLSKAEFIMGKNYMDLALYKEALIYLESAYQRSHQTTDTAFLGGILSTLGGAFTYLKDFERSRTFVQKAIELFAEDDSLRIAGLRYNLGLTYASDDMLDSAYQQYERALVLWKGLDYTNGLGHIYGSMAELFSKQGQYNRAIDYLLKGIPYLEKANNQPLVLSSKLRLAENYLKLNNVSRAEPLINEVSTAIRKRPSTRLWARLFFLKSLLYEQKGQYEKAFTNFKKHQTLNDSIFKGEVMDRAREVDKRLAFIEERKKQELTELKLEKAEKSHALEKAEQRFYITALVALILILSLVIGIFRWRHLREKSQLKRGIATSITENEALKKEIETKRRKLSTFTLKAIEKSERMEDTLEALRGITSKMSAEELEKTLQNVSKNLQKAEQTEQYWDEFELYFEEVHPDFFKNLQRRHPKLTSRDLRLSALLLLNLSTKEMASLLNSPIKTVEVARYRLRKKLDLPKDTSLHQYMSTVL